MADRLTIRDVALPRSCQRRHRYDWRSHWAEIARDLPCSCGVEVMVSSVANEPLEVGWGTRWCG